MTSILGLYPLAFFGIVIGISLVLGIILFLWYNQRQKRIHEEKAKGKLLCEFCSTEGAFAILCDVWKGMVRKVEHANRGTFTSDRWVKAPKGVDQFTDIYLVLQDHSYPVRWPEGKPWAQQITVMKTHYLVGDPIPKITYNPDKWSKEVYERTTTAIMKYAFDERTMQVITNAMGDVEGRIDKFLDYLKRVPLILVIELVLALLIIIDIFFSYSASSGIGTMLKSLRLK